MSEKCCETVPGPGGWHRTTCSNKAKVESDGRWYCTIHSPEYVAKKDAEKRARWKAEDDARSAKWNYEAGIKALGELVLARLQAGFCDSEVIEIARKHGLFP